MTTIYGKVWWFVDISGGYECLSGVNCAEEMRLCGYFPCALEHAVKCYEAVGRFADGNT